MTGIDFIKNLEHISIKIPNILKNIRLLNQGNILKNFYKL
jgi:hypothetical protein